ncbi:hypothetical protein N9N21_05475 [Alphaproteobacteria bacterium]|nr:hypothetical protein [Alphaproteobacteria bacterium]
MLPEWSKCDEGRIKSELMSTMGVLPDKVVVPFDSDGETWFVLDTLIKLGIQPVVVYFNAQYHDEQFFSMLNVCQENYDADFIGFTLPKSKIQAAISEEFSVGVGHCRNLEIYGRHAAALYTAKHLRISHIMAGPHQQSEVVGSHSFLVRNQLKSPAFNDIVMGNNLLPQVRNMITNVGSKFSQTFHNGVLDNLLEQIHWHYLSDYIFWDSESINTHYGEQYNISPRIVNGYGTSWQSSSSSLKLEFFDLLRLINTGSSKIDSYLSRDIRFERITRDKAIEIRERYLAKSWDLEGIAQFLDINHESIHKAVELYLKKRSSSYKPQSLDGNSKFEIVSHNQTLC